MFASASVSPACRAVPPGRLQLLLRAVALLQPGRELAQEVLLVRRAGVERLLRGVEEDVVLVLQLDEAQGRLLGVGQAGVGVLVLEQVDDHLDHQVLHVLGEVDEGVGVALEVLGDLVVGQQALAVAGHDVEAVGVRPAEVDAVFLQLGGEVVEPVEPLAGPCASSRWGRRCPSDRWGRRTCACARR